LTIAVELGFELWSSVSIWLGRSSKGDTTCPWDPMLLYMDIHRIQQRCHQRNNRKCFVLWYEMQFYYVHYTVGRWNHFAIVLIRYLWEEWHTFLMLVLKIDRCTIQQRCNQSKDQKCFVLCYEMHFFYNTLFDHEITLLLSCLEIYERSTCPFVLFVLMGQWFVIR